MCPFKLTPGPPIASLLTLFQVFDHLAKLLTTAYKHSSAPLPFFAQYVVNIQDSYVRMMLVTHANYGIAFLSQPDHMTHDST